MANPVSLLRAMDMYGVPAASEIVAAGYQAIGLYVPFPGNEGKCPARWNLEDLTEHDIVYWWVWEVSALAAEGGSSQAEADWQNASEGMNSVGLDVAGNVLYFANDAVVSDPQAVIDYFTTIGDLAVANGAFGGAYADDTVLEWVAPFIQRYWQTGAGSWQPLAWAHIYQGAPNDLYGYPWFQAFGTTCDADAIVSSLAGLGNLKGPWPPVQPVQEDNMNAYDPVSGGFWTVEADGAVFSFNGAPYLGALNIHPELAAGGKAKNGPVTGFSYYGLPTFPAGKQGYVIVTTDGSGVQHPYRFPRDGSLAKPGAAKK